MARKDLVGTKWLLRDFDAKIITPLQKVYSPNGQKRWL
jgi:hypothetical protein